MGRSEERARFVAQEADVSRFSSSVIKFLRSKLSGILRDLESADENEQTRALNAAKILGSLQSNLKAMGLDSEIAKVQAIFAKDIEAIAARFQRIRKQPIQVFSDIDRPMIESLIEGGFNQAAGYVERYLGDVREQVALKVLTGDLINVSGVVDAEGESLDRILNTELNTTLSAFHRSVTMSKSQELGFDLFEYIGPNDDVTRDFCQHLLDRNPPIYSLAEIRAMPEQSGLPVMQYGGGYNCRHIWAPISEEEARNEGWKGQNAA